MPLPVLLAVLLPVLLTACSTTRSQELAPVERGPVGLELVAEGPWREVPMEEGDAFHAQAGQRVVIPNPRAQRPPAAERRSAAAAPSGPPSLALLPRRGPPPASSGDGGPLPPSKSPEAMRRERYLDHPTRLRAERIAFYCPAALAHEVQLTGEAVVQKKPTRRVATGRARLFCRELTLEAEKITVNVRGEDPDLQITARGNVHFVTKQKVQMLREEGIRSLLITNEQIIPLR